MKPYSLDLLSRVAAAYRESGVSKMAVSRRFGVSHSFVKDLVRREKETGSLVPKLATGGRTRYLDAAAQAWLVAYMGQYPDATQAELNQAWQAQGGRSVCQTCLWQVLDEQRLRRKKKGVIKQIGENLRLGATSVCSAVAKSQPGPWQMRLPPVPNYFPTGRYYTFKHPAATLPTGAARPW